MNKVRKFYQLCQSIGFYRAIRTTYLWLRGKPDSTAKENLLIWSNYDWSHLGDEWIYDSGWMEEFIHNLFEPNIPMGSDILEIGPGAGRWTKFLIERASQLTIVDLTPECIEICKGIFRDKSNIRYFVNDGRDLSFIPDSSIDRIWSFDVFVHIDPVDIECYVKQFARLLKPDGRGIIHHSKNGASRVAWRSAMTAEKMREFCDKYHLLVIEQIEAFGEGQNHRLWPELPKEACPDIITIFERGWQSKEEVRNG